MTTTKEAIRRKKAIQLEHFVPADDEQATALTYAEQRYNLARFSGQEEEIEKTLAALEEIREKVRAEGVAFVLRGIGRVRFEELQREHPPTEEQVKETGATWNPDTFYAALLAETVESDMTAEEWQTEFLDSTEWGIGEIHEVREKAIKVNTMTRVVELGN